VLRFNVSCIGEPYIIHYYLADDTMDIREVHFANNGKDNRPLLLKRMKVPKAPQVLQPGQVDKEQPYWTVYDFNPGVTVHAFSRDFTILGVDEFTQDYMLRNFGKRFNLG
jgi:EF-hand domain-containing protein 1